MRRKVHANHRADVAHHTTTALTATTTTVTCAGTTSRIIEYIARSCQSITLALEYDIREQNRRNRPEQNRAEVIALTDLDDGIIVFINNENERAMRRATTCNKGRDEMRRLWSALHAIIISARIANNNLRFTKYNKPKMGCGRKCKFSWVGLVAR